MLLLGSLIGKQGVVPAVGAMPAWDSAGTVLEDVTLNGATNAPVRPASLAVGDLMVCEAAVFTADATSISITMHASMSGDGWAEVTGSPFVDGTGISEAALFWKIADASDVAGQGTAIPGGVTTSHNGSTTTDRMYTYIHRFTAADGFAATPFEDVSGSTGGGTGDVSMNTVTPTDINRLGVTHIAMNQDNQAVASSTGESGSDWAEVVEHEGAAELNSQVQTCDLSAGDPVSGGSSTHASSAGWITMSYALVPATA
jgi:hypothetical protein